ncbi:hypothetical protein [Candidatus Accumulibacter necessarius]|uniref:hypothetical protein n=1 Tax=Candidatus Accumulibacter necessarius TaxID=2954386 RepID=UPI003DA8977A
MLGKAIDIRIAGVPLDDLRDAAISGCRRSRLLRAANSFISTPAGCAPGNLARPFGGWLRPRPA